MIFCKNWTRVIKKQTKFSSEKVLVKLDFYIAKGTAMVAMQIFEICCKIMSIKNHQSSVHATTIVENFIPSCQCLDVTLSYPKIKLVIHSEYNIQGIDKNFIMIFNENKYKNLVDIQYITPQNL